MCHTVIALLGFFNCQACRVCLLREQTTHKCWLRSVTVGSIGTQSRLWWNVHTYFLQANSDYDSVFRACGDA